MTDPTPAPDPAVLAAEDEAVIDTGLAYAAALRADPLDMDAATAARQAFDDALAARGYVGA